MSYIRCLSNPEGLYVWSNGRRTTISHCVAKPHSSGRTFDVPSGAFNECLKKWAKNGDGPVSCRGIRVEELTVNEKTGAIIPEMKPCKRGCKKEAGGGFVPCRRCRAKMWRDVRRSRWVIRISYRNDFVNLWTVTWEYMTRRFWE